MQMDSVISISSRFNSHSSSNMAEIAARVVAEFGSQEFYDEEFYFEREEISAIRRSGEERDFEYLKRERGNSVEEEGNREYLEIGRENHAEDADEVAEFEFAFVTRDSELPSPISADEIFHNGQIRPVHPVSIRDLFMKGVEFQRENGEGKGDSEKVPKIRQPLRKLFNKERETTMTRTSSCSSSDTDDLDGIPSESYCVWRPKEEAAAEGRCKKSISTGSDSKRWKFKNLLNRSRSDGNKEDFVILSPKSGERKKGKVKSKAGAPLPPVYQREGGEKRRSYLPYRQDLVGVLGNVNGLSKSLQPF